MIAITNKALKKKMEYFLVAMVWGIPITWFLLTNHLIHKRARNIVSSFNNVESLLCKNLKVYFKNYDVLKRKKPFQSLSIYLPIYQFNICDLLISQSTILLIGKSKSKLFGRPLWINVSVISYQHTIEDQLKSGYIKLVKITLTNQQAEIHFRDHKFEKTITAIVRIDDNDQLRGAIESWIQENEVSSGEKDG